jgi:hypothetical protein
MFRACCTRGICTLLVSSNAQVLCIINCIARSAIWRTCCRRCSAIQNHNERRPCGKIIAQIDSKSQSKSESNLQRQSERPSLLRSCSGTLAIRRIFAARLPADKVPASGRAAAVRAFAARVSARSRIFVDRCFKICPKPVHVAQYFLEGSNRCSHSSTHSSHRYLRR